MVGKVFTDSTRNSQLDDGESGLEGRVVYIDANPMVFAMPVNGQP